MEYRSYFLDYVDPGPCLIIFSGRRCKLENARKGVDLTKLNDLLMAYGKFDVERGEFSLFSEIAAKDGKFVAYAKPLFRHIDVAAWESREHPNNKRL